MELKWTNWFDLHRLRFEDVPKEPGVYEVRWAVNGVPQTINRVDGADDSGLLYIGGSINLRRRIKNFWDRVMGGKAPHTAGHTYKAYNFERKFRPEQLQVRWALIPKEELQKAESHLLEEYVKKFLDKPPLNLSVKRKY